MNLNSKYALLILIFTGILIYLPFLPIALHTDEWGYMLMGKRILQNPWDPYHGTEKYEGEIVVLKYSSTFAPLIPYYFAFILWLTGSDSEIISRLFFIIFSPIALVSSYLIARRFLKNPFYPALMIAFSPAFFLLSHLTTTDISGLALSLAGFALFLIYIEKGRAYSGIFAGITLGISILIRYQNLYMISLIFLYSILSKKGVKKTFIVTLIVLLILLPWCIQNLYHYGTLHIISAGKSWKGIDTSYNPLNFLDTQSQKLASSVVIFGSSFLFFPCIIIILLIFAIKRIYLVVNIPRVLCLLTYIAFVF